MRKMLLDICPICLIIFFFLALIFPLMKAFPKKHLLGFLSWLCLRLIYGPLFWIYVWGQISYPCTRDRQLNSYILNVCVCVYLLDTYYDIFSGVKNTFVSNYFLYMVKSVTGTVVCLQSPLHPSSFLRKTTSLLNIWKCQVLIFPDIFVGRIVEGMWFKSWPMWTNGMCSIYMLCF